MSDLKRTLPDKYFKKTEAHKGKETAAASLSGSQMHPFSNPAPFIPLPISSIASSHLDSLQPTTGLEIDLLEQSIHSSSSRVSTTDPSPSVLGQTCGDRDVRGDVNELPLDDSEDDIIDHATEEDIKRNAILAGCNAVWQRLPEIIQSRDLSSLSSAVETACRITATVMLAHQSITAEQVDRLIERTSHLIQVGIDANVATLFAIQFGRWPTQEEFTALRNLAAMGLCNTHGLQRVKKR
jgi:hypothetical protein